MPARASSPTIALALALLGGCAGRNCCPVTTLAPAERAFDCRQVERQPVRPDVSMVGPPEIVPQISEDQKLCALSEQNAQCLAAANATIANLLVKEADATAAQAIGWCAHCRGSELTSEILRLEATHKRNTAAASALEAFLRLIEAEAGANNLEHRGQEIDSMLADIGRLQQHGLLSPVSKPEIEGQRIEMSHRRAELRSTIDKLNYQLKDLLGVAIADDARFWPETSLVVTTAAPEKVDAVNVALANRADLGAVRLAAGAGGQESAAAARTIIQLTGGLALPPPTSGLALLAHAHSLDHEGPVRRQQLAELLADRDRAARHETLQGVMVVETRLVQIGLTSRRVELAKEHLKAIAQQQNLTAGAPLDLRKTRLDVLAVEQDLLHDVIEWKLAVVKLKEAQGLLAVECGYDIAARTAQQGACCP